jgi:hypothetical protein
VTLQGVYSDLCYKAIAMLDKWSKEERYYNLIRQQNEGECRLAVLRHRRRGDEGLSDVRPVASLTVIVAKNGTCSLLILIDDYNRPSRQWLVYGMRTEALLQKNGYKVRGQFDFFS